MPHIGYLHRCAEKIGENLTPRQWIPYTDRMDYLAGMNMNLGWSLCVEKLMNYRVPERGRHLRVIIAEMGRIASHLVGMGAYGLDLGTFSPFLYAFREREKILDLFEEACGARLTYSYLTPGGATADLPPRLAAEVRGVPRPVRADHPGISRAAHDQRDLRQAHGRHRHPVARDGDRLRQQRPGAPRQRRRPRPAPRRRRDLHVDVRRLRLRSHLPSATATIPRTTTTRRCRTKRCSAIVGTGSTCGCWKSCRASTWCRQAIDRYSTSTGSYGEPIKLTQKLPKGEATSKPNAPRARWASTSSATASRFPGGPAPAAAASATSRSRNELCRGCLIADVPAIVGSLDIVMGEIDR